MGGVRTRRALNKCASKIFGLRQIELLSVASAMGRVATSKRQSRRAGKAIPSMGERRHCRPDKTKAAAGWP